MALAVTHLISSERIEGQNAVGENAALASLIKRTFPNYEARSERIINGINLQTITGKGGALGYSVILFDIGCSSCPNERLFVAASAKDRKIIAVELLAADREQHLELIDFLKQFVGKRPGDDLTLGSGIQIEGEPINLNAAIAITDRIGEFLRAINEVAQ